MLDLRIPSVGKWDKSTAARVRIVKAKMVICTKAKCSGLWFLGAFHLRILLRCQKFQDVPYCGTQRLLWNAKGYCGTHRVKEGEIIGFEIIWKVQIRVLVKVWVSKNVLLIAKICKGVFLGGIPWSRAGRYASALLTARPTNVPRSAAVWTVQSRLVWCGGTRWYFTVESPLCRFEWI